MEILRCRESLRLDESKVLGSKVMLKGTVIIDLLYLPNFRFHKFLTDAKVGSWMRIPIFG